MIISRESVERVVSRGALKRNMHSSFSQIHICVAVANRDRLFLGEKRRRNSVQIRRQ